MAKQSLMLSKPLAQWRRMQLSGLKTDPDQERPIGAALAARLPQIIAAATKPATRVKRRRRIPL